MKGYYLSINSSYGFFFIIVQLSPLKLLNTSYSRNYQQSALLQPYQNFNVQLSENNDNRVIIETLLKPLVMIAYSCLNSKCQKQEKKSLSVAPDGVYQIGHKLKYLFTVPCIALCNKMFSWFLLHFI